MMIGCVMNLFLVVYQYLLLIIIKLWPLAQNLYNIRKNYEIHFNDSLKDIGTYKSKQRYKKDSHWKTFIITKCILVHKMFHWILNKDFEWIHWFTTPTFCNNDQKIKNLFIKWMINTLCNMVSSNFGRNCLIHPNHMNVL